MSTAAASEEIKAIRVLPFSGQQQDWDEWSEKYQGIAAERGYLQVLLGNEDVPWMLEALKSPFQCAL